jgi:hypothetical protein
LKLTELQLGKNDNLRIKLANGALVEIFQDAGEDTHVRLETRGEDIYGWGGMTHTRWARSVKLTIKVKEG